MLLILRTVLCLLLLVPTLAAAQEAKPAADQPPPKLPEIVDEPKTIDPATLMPAKLAEAATVDLSSSSLRELVEWLQTQRQITVLLDQNALSEIGVSPGEPVSERLDNAPVYLLLNRLVSLGVAWTYEDDILHITSVDEASQRLTTVPYNIGDLLDAGYDLDDLRSTVQNAIAPTQWDQVGGPGALSFLGDVMFVRQTDQLQRNIQGLLAALRKHGRQTYIFDPPQHLAIRQKLAENVSVEYLDTPLESAVRQLAEQAKIDIRLDMPSLRRARIREREPITLKLTERKLETVLQSLVVNFQLTWILRDGVLWITSRDDAGQLLKTAVYDVRDLCRDAAESAALSDALLSQADPTAWSSVGGPGDLTFARPGSMVIYNTERIQNDVLNLLETYRAALRMSRPRDRNAVDPKEVTTVYYRLHANVAADLASLLPNLVQPGSWKSEQNPAASGEIYRAASDPELLAKKGQVTSASSGGASADALVVDRAVLIVRQTRAAHDEIAEVIRRVQHGDVKETVGGGLGGGGGFGGGFFKVD